ncbi:MAG TPA: hypothetical protein PKA80_13375, partial [Ignavibacteriaceae bacterium]|nr:hypothetical protein [Ignavibacteriaceae bacterium]
MNTGIDIEFFEPSFPDNKKTGKLYIDENGKDYLEYMGSWTDAFKMSCTLIKIIYAYGIQSREKYTLINSSFSQSSSNYLRFVINELYKGDYMGSVLENNCIEIEARVTQLTNWIDYSRINHENAVSEAEQSRIILDKAFTGKFSISQNISLELCEYCGAVYDRNETILRNISTAKFICKIP